MKSSVQIFAFLLFLPTATLAAPLGDGTEKFFDDVQARMTSNAKSMINEGRKLPPQVEEAASFLVEITTAQSSVRNNQSFILHTKITNRETASKELRVWGCSYHQNWTSDNRVLSIDAEICEKNAIMTVHLAPGQSYEKDLSVRVSVEAAEMEPQRLTFRLGFSSSTVRTIPAKTILVLNLLTAPELEAMPNRPSKLALE